MSHLRHAGAPGCLDHAHQARGVEARVEPRENRRLGFGRAQLLGHRNDALEVEIGFAGRVLHARAQRQLQAKAVAARIGRQRAVAVHARTGHERGPYPGSAAHTFFDRAAVV